MISSLLQFIVSACTPLKSKESGSGMSERLEWAPGVCAPEFYPVTVYRGDFYTETDWLSIPNGGTIDVGWGDNGMNMDRGGIIPDGFSITYFAYMENKFYTGKFALPKEKIEQLFNEGLIGYRTKKYVTYDAMIVGMAPGGMLVVWMMSRDNQIEIGRYQAEEMDLKWKIFNPRVQILNSTYIPSKKDIHLIIMTAAFEESNERHLKHKINFPIVHASNGMAFNDRTNR